MNDAGVIAHGLERDAVSVRGDGRRTSTADKGTEVLPLHHPLYMVTASGILKTERCMILRNG